MMSTETDSRIAKRTAEVDKNNRLFLSVFDSPDGKIILTDMLDKYYKYTSFTPGEPETTAFKEGQRSVVIYIMDRISRAEKKA